jgi:Flp pilus assembly protein TadG
VERAGVSNAIGLKSIDLAMLVKRLGFVLRRFGANQKATTAVEFATLLPIFSGFLFLTAQIGLYFYYSATLYRVVEASTRPVLIGTVANEGLTATQFRNNILCPMLPGGMSCANVITNIQTAPSYASGSFYNSTNIVYTATSPLGYVMTGLNQPPMNNNLTSFCIGTGGTVITVQVFYAMPILGLSWLIPGSTTWNGQQVIFISATSVFMNEPFVTTNTEC